MWLLLERLCACLLEPAAEEGLALAAAAVGETAAGETGVGVEAWEEAVRLGAIVVDGGI